MNASPTQAWLLLAASVLAEVLGTVALRHANGFTRIGPSVVTAVCYAGAIWLMSWSVRQLDMGLAYAVWAASGTALVAVVGMVCFGEATSPWRLVGLGLIVLGVVALKLSARG
jgi:small multidrug resistance pump